MKMEKDAMNGPASPRPQPRSRQSQWSRRPIRRNLLLAAAALAMLAGCQKEESKGTAGSENRLEIMSWWTSGSESAALKVFQDAFLQKHPGVSLVDGAVVGGGGSNEQVVLAQRLAANRPPDVWQTFLGASLAAWVASGRIANVDTVYQDTGLAKALPKAVLDAVTIGGHQYGVPTGAHRGDVLFFNKDVLSKAGIAAPGADYADAAFKADLDKLSAAHVTPLCLGGRDAITRVELFENVLLGVIGADGWERIARDRFDWDGPELHKAAQRFGELLDRADPDADSQSWDEAAKRLADGRCAFLVFNDSALGEWIRSNATDIGHTTYPGTRSLFTAVIDTFVVARKAKSPALADDLLRTMADPETDLAFNKIKGSIPLRTDIPLDSLTPYQQEAARDLRGDKLLMSLTHGELLGPDLQAGLFDAVRNFAKSRDPAVFGRDLRRAVASGTAIAP